MTLFNLTTIVKNDWVNGLLSRLGALGQYMKFHPELVPITNIDGVENQPIDNLFCFRRTSTGEIVPAKLGYRFMITFMSVFGAAAVGDASNVMLIQASVNKSQDVVAGLVAAPLTVNAANFTVGCKILIDNNVNVALSKTGFTTFGQAVVSGYYVRN